MRITNMYKEKDNKHNTMWHDVVSKFNMSLCPEDKDENKSNVNQIKNKSRKTRKRQWKTQNCCINKWTNIQYFSA